MRPSVRNYGVNGLETDHEPHNLSLMTLEFCCRNVSKHQGYVISGGVS